MQTVLSPRKVKIKLTSGIFLFEISGFKLQLRFPIGLERLTRIESMSISINHSLLVPTSILTTMKTMKVHSRILLKNFGPGIWVLAEGLYCLKRLLQNSRKFIF